jgi:starvation-inducible outer membrane lipoprotein
MPRPLRKTAVTSLKMTPEVRNLWEQCAAAEDRSLTNLFEVLVRAHAKKLGILPRPLAATARPTVQTKKTRPSNPEKKQ